MKNTRIIIMALSLLSISITAATAPPESAIKKLEIFAADASNRTAIYANGKMQAELNVIYELEQGYTVKNVEIKKLKTEGGLTDWKVEDKSNGFLNQFPGGVPPLDEAFYEDATVKFYQAHSAMDAKTQMDLAVGKVQSTTKYLSTSRPTNESVCVILTVSNGTDNSKQSTCDGSTNNASVYIAAHEPRKYSIDDFDIKVDFDNKFRKFTDMGITFEYAIKALTLKPKSNGGLSKAFKLKAIDTTNLVDHNPDKNRHIVASHYTVLKSGGDTDSILYVMGDPEQVVANYPLYYRAVGINAATLRDKKVTTNGEINIDMIFGRHEQKKGGLQGTFSRDINKPEYETRNVNFYDQYGNHGQLKVRRSSIQIEKHKFNDLGYELY